jgi:uncharacterized membrane protein
VLALFTAAGKVASLVHAYEVLTAYALPAGRLATFVKAVISVGVRHTVRVLLAVLAIAVLLMLKISESADEGQRTVLVPLFIVSVAALTVLAAGMVVVSNSIPI